MTGRSCQAAIFDLDGTLLDTLEDLGDCMNRVLERHGYPPHPVRAYRFFVGDGFESLVRRSLPESRRQEAEIRSLDREARAEYAEHWADKTRPYDGIPELLEALSRRGIRLAILSNKPHDFTRRIAAHYFPDGLFEHVIGSREGRPRKPDPAAALEIADAWGLPPEQIQYLGDTDTDMQTGRRAGMFTVGVLWGFRPREELLEHGAQALVAAPAEIQRLFGE